MIVLFRTFFATSIFFITFIVFAHIFVENLNYCVSDVNLVLTEESLIETKYNLTYKISPCMRNNFVYIFALMSFVIPCVFFAIVYSIDRVEDDEEKNVDSKYEKLIEKI